MSVPAPHPNGVFFGLPEADYHAAFALSNSGIKHLLTSTLDFWARSVLNPDREDEQTDAMALGTAYDVRIIAGKEAFNRMYAPAVETDDYPGALVTSDEIREALKGLGLKTGGKKDELIARLLDKAPDVQIWDHIKADHAKQHEGKTLLPFKLIRKIEIAAAMIEKHPILSKCFTGGFPQVSVFWTDDMTGVPMKARLDYLKTKAIVDLKTYSNPYGKPIDRAIESAMASGKYHIQASVYMDAVEKAVEFMDDGRVFGEIPDKAWLQALRAANERQFVFVFQATGVAPVARGKVLGNGTVMDAGRMASRSAKEVFRYCLEKYGSDPWVDETPIQPFDETAFPNFMFEV